MEIFKLFGSIFVDNEKANASISKTDEVAETLSNKFINGAKVIGEWGKKLGTVASVGATALGVVVTQTVNATTEIEKFAKVTGMTTDEYQRWDAVMKSYGYSMEQASGDLASLGEKALDCANGVGEGAELFAKLGVVVTDSSGKLKSQEQIFNETITALQGMENATERNAIASALLSTTGEELAPILGMTNEELEKMKGNANVIPQEQIDKAREIKTSYDSLKNTFTVVTSTILLELMPAFQSLIEWVEDCIEWLSQNEETVLTVAEAVGVFALAWGGFKFGELLHSFKAMKDGLLAWQMSTHGASVTTGLLNGSLTTAQWIWALLTGQISMAEIKTYAMATAQKLLNFVMNANPIGIVIGLITLLVGAFVLAYNKSESFRNMVNGLWGTIKTVFTNIGTTVVNTFTNAYNKGVSLFNSLKDKVSSIINAIKGFFKFTISFPKIKLPHFSIKPKGWDIGDLLKGSIPKLGISWYAKAMDDGMILDSPTIFGMQNGKLLGGGEVGSETVVGTKSLLEMIQQAVSQSNNALAPILMKIYELISDEDKIHRLLVKALTDGGFSVVLDGREVGRIVRSYA